MYYYRRKRDGATLKKHTGREHIQLCWMSFTGYWIVLHTIWSSSACLYKQSTLVVMLDSIWCSNRPMPSHIPYCVMWAAVAQVPKKWPPLAHACHFFCLPVEHQDRLEVEVTKSLITPKTVMQHPCPHVLRRWAYMTVNIEEECKRREM